jgi:hypothetical protein
MLKLINDTSLYWKSVLLQQHANVGHCQENILTAVQWSSHSPSWHCFITQCNIASKEQPQKTEIMLHAVIFYGKRFSLTMLHIKVKYRGTLNESLTGACICCSGPKVTKHTN